VRLRGFVVALLFTTSSWAQGDAARGRALVADRFAGMCLLFHRAPIPEERFQGDLAPDLATVLLMERVPIRFRDGSLPPYVPLAGPSIEIVRAHPRYVERVHSRGHQVHVWTVDDEADIALCLELGVDAIITNRPRAVLTAVGR